MPWHGIHADGIHAVPSLLTAAARAPRGAAQEGAQEDRSTLS